MVPHRQWVRPCRDLPSPGHTGLGSLRGAGLQTLRDRALQTPRSSAWPNFSRLARL